MRMLDLFAGRLGWTKAFLARGWECVAVDLIRPERVPEGVEFVQADVLLLTSEFVEQFDFVCASSPCEEFSKTCKGGLGCFYPDPPFPSNGIRLFNHTREICYRSTVPHVLENVRGAEQWVGNAVHHAGPFYLWGTAVPPLMPKGITKGTTNMLNWNKNPTKGPQKSAAELATIPLELANCVAEYAERLLEAEARSRGTQLGS